MKLFLFAGEHTDRKSVDQITAALKKANHTICDNVTEADMIVSLGGDGTLLTAAQLAIGFDKVLTGINCGRVGYLCLMKQEEIDDFDVNVSRGSVVEKTLLNCEIGGKGHILINDVVVGKDNQGQSADLDLLVDGQYRYNVRCDGLIICTPTGSSAYNLSAAGPLLEEGSGVLGITPICSQAKGVYPLVVSDNRSITVSVKKDTANVYGDGVLLGTITDSVTVTRASRKLKLLQKKVRMN